MAGTKAQHHHLLSDLGPLSVHLATPCADPSQRRPPSPVSLLFRGCTGMTGCQDVREDHPFPNNSPRSLEGNPRIFPHRQETPSSPNRSFASSTNNRPQQW